MPEIGAELEYFNSYFLAQSVVKQGTAWQQLVTDIMIARHGGAFIQVDPTFNGDKGCDGFVEGLMLACYGGARPTSKSVANKVNEDFAKAKKNWPDVMKRWAFVHNNVVGLPLMAVEALIALKATEAESGYGLEVWPPQALWREAVRELERDQLIVLFGAPPTARPAGMTYIAEAVRSLSRTRKVPSLEPITPVPLGKIEFNDFDSSTAELIKQYQVHTHLVRYYFEQTMPGEHFQVTLSLQARYAGLTAILHTPDAVFHALCDELVDEAFISEPTTNEAERRSAALLIVTHFFESCLIFEMPTEDRSVSTQ
jgi:hypothetical protein